MLRKPEPFSQAQFPLFRQSEQLVMLRCLPQPSTAFKPTVCHSTVYIFRNRHRFFDQDPNVSKDIPAARKLRIEVILLPWFGLTLYLLVMLIQLWRD